MERAAPGCPGSRRGAATVDAIRQADQCRFPERGLDPADQHHDAGARQRACVTGSTGGHRRTGAGAAAGRGRSTNRSRGAYRGSVTRAGGRQETAAGTETHAGSTSPAFAGTGGADSVIHSRGACERMIVFKVAAAR